MGFIVNTSFFRGIDNGKTLQQYADDNRRQTGVELDLNIPATAIIHHIEGWYNDNNGYGRYTILHTNSGDFYHVENDAKIYAGN